LLQRCLLCKRFSLVILSFDIHPCLDLSFVVGFQLAGANRPIALANANAILRRVELVCEVHTMSFFFGAILFDHCMLLCALLLILVSLSLFVFCR
jgi:hypothetical protein